MSDSAILRARGLQLIAGAIRAHDHGDKVSAELLTERAMQLLAEADATEGAGQQQQQQQIQPKKEAASRQADLAVLESTDFEAQ
jgi:hypothetical protein